MALWDRQKSPVARLKIRDWTDEEGRKELFREVAAKQDIKLKEVMWLLTAPEGEVRALGGSLLGRFSGKPLANALLNELKGKTQAQQRLLMRHVLRCEPEDIQSVASNLLADPDRLRRNLGIFLVNGLSLKQAGHLIQGLLKDPTADVRLAGLEKLLEDPNTLHDPTLRGLVLEMGNDDDERLRLAVLKTVANSATLDAEMTALLVHGMQDPSYSIQKLSSQTLGDQIKAGNERLEESLIALLSDGSTSVRTAVIGALLDSPNRSGVIRRYLAHTRTLAGWVRDRALESLKAFKDDLMEPVIELMNDDDDEIRLLALGVGSHFEDPRCVQPIIGLLEGGDWWTRATAAETLGRIGDPRAIQPLIKQLGDEDSRWTAIEALGQLKAPEILEPLLPFLDDHSPEIRLATLEALSGLGHRPEVLQALESHARKDDAQSVRVRSLELLRKVEEASGSGRNLDEIEAATRHVKGGMDYNELEQLLIETRNRDGSDLHLSVGLPPIFRIHGDLERHESEPLTDDRIRTLVTPLLTERQKEKLTKDLQVDLCYTVPNVGRYRANIFEQRIGLGGVFRVIPGLVPTFNDIGMPDHMADLVNYHQGLIVVAGPSGSGKSTTLAALVNLFNENKRAHILTIEDPIEFVHPMKNCLVNQREVGKHTQSFAKALKGALREDPDVIMVGEMRDNETMRMALEAAETGHLVIATLNTTAAPKTVDRLIESFPPMEQGQVRAALAESLKAVICQNLLPLKEGRGRVALFELLMGSPSVRSLIRDNKTYQLLSAMQIGRNYGMRTVDMSLEALVSQGKISGEQAYLRAQKKELFESMVSDAFLREAMGTLEPSKDERTAS